MRLFRHFISFTIGVGVAITFNVIAEDWNNPTVTSTYSNVLSDLKARDVSNAKMNYSGATNIESGFIGWNATSGKFEIWNGSAWSDLQPSLTAHLSSTSNPHSVTAAQVGAPTTATLSAHTSSTSNPHSVTAAQVGALAISSNLNDLGSKATARTNLSVPSIADLSSHTSNTSNPHSVTTSQIGALRASNNLSDVANAATARGNIEAARSGSNLDISSLGAVNNLTATYGMTINSGLGALTFGPASSSLRWKVEVTGKITPPASLQADYTVWPGSWTRRTSLDPSVATAGQCAEAWNTLIEDLIGQGILK